MLEGLLRGIEACRPGGSYWMDSLMGWGGEVDGVAGERVTMQEG